VEEALTEFRFQIIRWTSSSILAALFVWLAYTFPTPKDDVNRRDGMTLGSSIGRIPPDQNWAYTWETWGQNNDWYEADLQRRAIEEP